MGPFGGKQKKRKSIEKKIVDMKVLEKAGRSCDDVIKTVNYITPQPLLEYPKTAQVRRGYFKGNYPAATGIVVHSLLRPDWPIEIDLLAVLE